MFCIQVVYEHNMNTEQTIFQHNNLSTKEVGHSFFVEIGANFKRMKRP